jgi:o-succinylbenzoate---CoA ligase
MRELSIIAAAREGWDAPALVFGDEVWSWVELGRRVTAEMAALGRLGLGRPGGPPRARLVVRATPETVVRLLALVQLGVTVVPLHARWTVAERSAVAALDPAAWDLDSLPVAMRPSRFLPLADRREIPPSRPLAVVFTSGSSGVPRGVILTRAAFVASAAASAARLGWRRDDRWLLSLPPAHVGGLSVLMRCLAARRAVVLAEGLDAGALIEVMRASHVTLVSLVAPMLARLLEAGEVPSSLRVVLLGGGPCPTRLVGAARSAGWPLVTTYGLTETCSQVATQAPGQVKEPEEVAATPLEGVELRIVGGRIQVRGDMLMAGYFPRGRHEEPFTDDGFLDTGDLGLLDANGRLHVLGRADDVIVTGGENVSPLEVEEALLRCGSVTAAVVFGTPAEPWGQVVAAALVAGPEGPVPGSRLLAVLGDLAPFKRPRLVAWVPELPLGPSGKPDRLRVARELRGVLRPIASG